MKHWPRPRPADGRPSIGPATLTRLGVSLRPEEPADAAFVRQLYHAGRAEEVAAAGWPQAMATPFLHNQFRLQRAHYAANHATAALQIVVAPPERGLPPAPIGRLYVDRSAPVWRLLEIALLGGWQRRGIGAALIREIQHDVANAGAAGLALNVLHSNPRAAALYARLGFADGVSLIETHRAMIWHPSGRAAQLNTA